MPPRGRRRPEVEHVEEVMRKLMGEYPTAVLFGGWATYLRTGVAKSHDIDIIVDHSTLERLRSKHALSESRHIGGRKYELKLDGVGVDVYPVYQSKLGRELQLPVEALARWSERIGPVRVLTAEAQFVAKMAALLDRPDTLPGEKDRQEMWALLDVGPGVDFRIVAGLLGEASKSPAQQASLISKAFDLLEETPDLNKTSRAALRRLRSGALESLRPVERGRDEQER
ncbi:MAG TPA: hypothetical protein VHM88_25380 [Candidatus Acidoferrales bacterium]|nr:hypothetical protein [Candidatus Acidoferrales bacterium]